MTTLREASQQALEAWDTRAGIDAANKAFEALRVALAQEQAERKPLTQKEVFEWMDRAPRGLATMSLDSIWLVVFRYAEMAHGIRKNK